MLVKFVTQEEIDEALAKTNELFDGNIKLVDLRVDRTRRDGRQDWRFTLKSASYDRPGFSVTSDVRRDRDGEMVIKERRAPHACWHAYGEFIDALPDHAEVEAGGMGWGKIVVKGGRGNWQDMQTRNPAWTDRPNKSDQCECWRINEENFRTRRWHDLSIVGENARVRKAHAG